MEQAVLQELAEVQEHQVQAEQVVLQEHRELAEAQELQVQVEHQVLAEVQELQVQAERQVLAELQDQAVLQVTMVQIVEDGHGRVQFKLMLTLYRTTLSQILVL